MSSPSNPFRSLFKSSSSPSPDSSHAHISHSSASKGKGAKATSGTRDGRAMPKIRVTKTTSTSTTSTVSDTSAPYSMLLPPTALFPPSVGKGSSTETGAKSPKLQGLFSKVGKKSKSSSLVVEEIFPAEKPTGWYSKPWASWEGGEAVGSEETVTQNLDVRRGSASSAEAEVSSSSKGFSARIWSSSKASKSETDVASVTIEKQQQQQQSKERYFRTKKKISSMLAGDSQRYGGGGGNAPGSEIMLHPSYNLSDRSVASVSSSFSDPHRQQQLTTTTPCQQQDMQQQHQYRYSSSQEQVCIHQQQLYQQHQQHEQQHRPPRLGVTLAVHDVFGIGKVTEMTLALFLAHDAFLSRRPFWMQCAIMAWEALVVLLLVWGVLRVVGLAEVVVWGADDLVRGTLSTLQAFGHAMRIVFVR